MSGNLYRDIDEPKEPLKDRIKRSWQTSLVHDLVDPIKIANAKSKVSRLIKKLDVDAPNASELLAKIDEIIYCFDLHTGQFGSSLNSDVLELWEKKKKAIEAQNEQNRDTEKEGKTAESAPEVDETGIEKQ